jgi:hypothetical protein
VTTTLLVFVVGSFPLHTQVNDAETDLKSRFHARIVPKGWHGFCKCKTRANANAKLLPRALGKKLT